MAGLPAVTVIGTLVGDPEMRFTTSGVGVVNFTVAANDRRFDKDRNEWVDGDATFLRCNLWRQPAENVVNSLSKGHRVIVVGDLRQRSYDTKEGEKRTVYELNVTEIGPSLKWATTTITKATKSSGGGGSSRPASEEPPPLDDEPPF